MVSALDTKGSPTGIRGAIVAGAIVCASYLCFPAGPTFISHSARYLDNGFLITGEFFAAACHIHPMRPASI